MTVITWLGHSTVLVESGGQRLITDPVLRSRIGPVRRRPSHCGVQIPVVDAVLLSHLHHDHFDVPSLRLLPPVATVIVPRGGYSLVPTRFKTIEEVVPGDTIVVGSVTVRAVRAEHGGSRLPFGPSAGAVGFLIEGSHRMYFAGDTALFAEMAELAAGLDVAVLPVGGWGPTLRGGHMNPVEAGEALRLLQPKVAIPVHWGTLWPIGLGRVRRDRFEQPARAFYEAARAAAPEVLVQVLYPGGSVDVELLRDFTDGRRE